MLQCMYISHFVYHVSLHGQSGSFHLPALVNNAVPNEVHKYLLETLLSMLWDIYSEENYWIIQLFHF